MNSKNKTSSINAFDFDLGLGSGGAKPMNSLKNQGQSYSSTPQQKSNTTSPWTQQPNKPAWSHQPVGSLSGPTSMVGDISGKNWNASPSSTSTSSGIGIVNGKNPNLFGDLLGSSMGNKSNSNVPLKNVGQNVFSMGSVSNSLPKPGVSSKSSGLWGSNGRNSGGNTNGSNNFGRGSGLGGGIGNMNVGVNSSINSNLGGPSMKSMSGSGIGAGGMGMNKDPFGSLVDFNSKPQGGVKSASKESDTFGQFQNPPAKPNVSTFETNKTDPMDNFVFGNTQTSQTQETSVKPAASNDFDAFFSSSSNGGNKVSEDFTSQQFSGAGDDDWGMNSEFDGGATTTELEGLPPPPAGVTAPFAKSKGMDNYKQGQFADAIKWLSWAVVLFEKGGNGDGTMEVLTSRASCYKEVGEYKKAVADCTKVLERDGKNVSVLVQRALLYESMEKYKLGAEDLRTVMKLDPGNRVARSTVHRLTKMAEQ